MLLSRVVGSLSETTFKRQRRQQSPVRPTETPAEPTAQSQDMQALIPKLQKVSHVFSASVGYDSSHSAGSSCHIIGTGVPAAPAPAAINNSSHHPAEKQIGVLIRSSILKQQQQQQGGISRPSTLYRSPVVRQTVSVKVNRPPSTDPAQLEKFNHQLAAAVQTALQVAVQPASAAATVTTAATPAPAAASNCCAPQQQQQQQQHQEWQQQACLPLITDITAFPGCHQAVMHFVLPRGALQQQQQQQQHLLWQQQLQQHVDSGVRQVLAGWSGLELISTTLLPPQQQQQQLEDEQDIGLSQAPGYASSTAAAAAAPAAASTDGHLLAPLLVTSHVPGVHLQPLVLSMPLNAATSTTSSSSSNDSNCTITAAAAAAEITAAAAEIEAEVHLHVAAAAVHQLRAAGHNAVRVVAAAVAPTAAASEHIPTNLLLLDQVHSLLPAAATAAAAAAATAADIEEFEVPVQLRLQQQQQQWQVLTVVIMAAGSPQNSGDQSSGTVAAESVPSVAVAAAVDSVGGSTAAHIIPCHAVISCVPLLLLPAGAAAELQGLSKDSCLHHDRDLLPLLHDLAVVLTAHSINNSSSSSSSVATWQSGAVQAMVESLIDCFTANNLPECKRLLEDLSVSVAAATAVMSGSSDTVAPQPAAELAAGESVEPQLGGYSGHVEPAERTDSSSNNNNNSSSSSGLPYEPDSNKPISPKEPNVSSSSSSSSKSNSPTSTSGIPDPAMIPVDALTLSVRTVLFGFEPAAAEAAYQCYKGAALLHQDFYNMVLHAVGACCIILWLITMALNSTTTLNEIITIVLRAQFVVFHTLFSSIEWAASAFSVNNNNSLRFIQQHRGLVLLGGMLFVLLITVTEYNSSGAVGTAARAAFEQYKNCPECLLIFRHVLQPLLARANIWPMTVVYLTFQLFVFDRIFGYLTAYGLGAVGTAGLVMCVHLGIAVVLEHNMRRSFVRYAKARM